MSSFSSALIAAANHVEDLHRIQSHELTSVHIGGNSYAGEFAQGELLFELWPLRAGKASAVLGEVRVDLDNAHLLGAALPGW